MRIPSNIILKDKYTIGKEYIYSDTYEPYQGFYYEVSNKFFAGKDFDPNAREIIKKDSTQVNRLLLNPKTAEYGRISNVQLPISTPPPPQPNFFENVPDGLEEYDAYFYKRIIGKNILIKQIDKETYGKYRNNPVYQVIKVKIDNSDTRILPEELARADKEMPGFGYWFLSGGNSSGGDDSNPEDFFF